MATIANTRLGRIALHLACIVRGSDYRMHLAGVLRECLPVDIGQR
jgi:hypothetical protein